MFCILVFVCSPRVWCLALSPCGIWSACPWPCPFSTGTRRCPTARKRSSRSFGTSLWCHCENSAILQLVGAQTSSVAFGGPFKLRDLCKVLNKAILATFYQTYWMVSSIPDVLVFKEVFAFHVVIIVALVWFGSVTQASAETLYHLHSVQQILGYLRVGFVSGGFWKSISNSNNNNKKG